MLRLVTFEAAAVALLGPDGHVFGDELVDAKLSEGC